VMNCTLANRGTAVSDHTQMLRERPFGVMNDESHTRQPGYGRFNPHADAPGNGRFE